MANMSNAMQVDQATLASAFKLNADPSQLAAIAASMLRATPATYESNLSKMGYADLNKPTSINIYPKDFASKEKIVEILNTYNADAKAAGEESKVITYTDIVGALMSSVTLIVDMISAMLIAFVSISLVVSSIMIGIITFISVLERKKELVFCAPLVLPGETLPTYSTRRRLSKVLFLVLWVLALRSYSFCPQMLWSKPCLT